MEGLEDSGKVEMATEAGNLRPYMLSDVMRNSQTCKLQWCLIRCFCLYFSALMRLNVLVHDQEGTLEHSRVGISEHSHSCSPSTCRDCFLKKPENRLHLRVTMCACAMHVVSSSEPGHQPSNYCTLQPTRSRWMGFRHFGTQ